MEQRNQGSNVTAYNRYPSIFASVAKIFDGKIPSILSFGCSTGEEVRTLKDLYFTRSHVTGVDFCQDIIEKNKVSNEDPLVSYYTPLELKSTKNTFDIIFCMSVLCMHFSKDMQPNEVANGYKFETFEQTVNDIHNLLNIDGVIVLFNEAYSFEETDIYRCYEKVQIARKCNAFVKKWYKNGMPVEESRPLFIYKKIK